MALEENRQLFKHNTIEVESFLLRIFLKKCNLDRILFIFIHTLINSNSNELPYRDAWAACESFQIPLVRCMHVYVTIIIQLLTDALKSVRIVPTYLKDNLQTLAI